MKLRWKLLPIVVLSTLSVWAGAAAARNGTSSSRVWNKRVTAPAQFDLSLAEVRFGAPAHAARADASRSPARGWVRLALRGSTGFDYVAAAVTRFRVLGRPRALVLVVNRRPRGSLAPDLAWVGLTVTASRGLGAPALLSLSDPFTRPSTGLSPALCDLPVHGLSLVAGDLRSVLSRGLALSGFSAERAIASAYDAVCGAPYDAGFRLAVTQGSVSPCGPAQANILVCCPPNAMCVAPPCPPCPCGVGPCPVPLAQSRQSVIACPLQAPPVACPL
jgi:hypothetical protein